LERKSGDSEKGTTCVICKGEEAEMVGMPVRQPHAAHLLSTPTKAVPFDMDFVPRFYFHSGLKIDASEQRKNLEKFATSAKSSNLSNFLLSTRASRTHLRSTIFISERVSLNSFL
jgi:hypothetical protein